MRMDRRCPNPREMLSILGKSSMNMVRMHSVGHCLLTARRNSKRFSRGIVGEAKSKVIDTIVNTHAFFALYATIDGL